MRRFWVTYASLFYVLVCSVRFLAVIKVIVIVTVATLMQKKRSKYAILLQRLSNKAYISILLVFSALFHIYR